MTEIPMQSFLAKFLAPETRVWRGKQRLSKAFWNYGVFISSILILLYVLARDEANVALQQVLLLGFAAFTAWILVSIWRCANNAEIFWRSLTRWLIVAWAANAAMVLGFLQLDLIATYLGH